MSFKYSIVDLDKDTYKQFKKILKERKQPQKPDVNLDKPEQVQPLEQPKKKRGRRKLSPEEKAERKKKRTPEENEKIRQKMAKLREARKAKKLVKK
jgi:hypothetical protein